MDEDGKSQPYSKGPRCFSCHQHGHVASRCSSKVAMYGGVNAIMDSEDRQETYIGRGGGSVFYLGGLNGTK